MDPNKSISLALTLNKRNGQISTYIKKESFPKDMFRELKHSNKRKLLVDIKELI